MYIRFPEEPINVAYLSKEDLRGLWDLRNLLQSASFLIERSGETVESGVRPF
jgi:hypothetical protein